ncbi:MAG: T9SS type A sorting domain-containing protein [Ignavibacteriales bacterium]|nr:T9SS type A sorting domain-containing protein [Ignavibacteriales bacterium]
MKKFIFSFFLMIGVLIFNSQSIAQNGSALFDGAGSRMRVADGNAASPNAFRINGSAITVEAWIYPLSYPNSQLGNTIVARTLNTVYSEPWISYRLWINHANGVSLPAFSISAGTIGSTVTVQSPEDIPSFQWIHLAATYDGTFLTIYVNGLQKAQVNTSISINSANGVGFYVGRYLTDAFQGAIDEVRLWNITRSQSQIQAFINSQLIGNEAGLAGYWDMNSSSLSGGSMLDRTANHNNLPVQGSTPIIPFNPLSASGTAILIASPNSIDFGSIEQGSTSIRQVTLTNNGTGPLLGMFQQSSNVEVTSGSVFFLATGQSSNISLGLKPLIPGNISGLLQAKSNASPADISFSILSIALRQIDANNISMWTLRDGRFSINPVYNIAGLEWPKGSGKTLAYSSGIWVAAKVNSQVRSALAWYNSEFQPGPILGVGGVAANPNDNAYRVFKISAGDNSSTNEDYAEWPASLGAQVNSDGTPKIIGDQTLFAVYNDLNQSKHSFGSAPLGAEVQQTTFAFNNSDARSNTVFLNFKIVNKSNSTWQDAYVSLWCDPDLGNGEDDLNGVDVPRNMGYFYNGNPVDDVYGNEPPAIGYKVLKGAFFTKPIQAFSSFLNIGPSTPQGDPNTSQKAYNYMQGLWADGTPYLDPTNSYLPTTFALNGDPVPPTTGWIDSSPNDRRFLLSTGPFNLDPGQSKDFVVAIIVGQGNSNIESITALRSASDDIQSLYDNAQIYGGALVDVVQASASSGSSNTVNDITNSGSQITFTGGTGGAVVESASYVEAPPGATSITTPSVGGVGKYLDVQVQGTVSWPVKIRIYYTKNDLLQAGIVESDLQGLYYWSGLTNSWNLYSNSGSDDQSRGTSTTFVDTTNININSVNYEGYVEAEAFHLTPIIVGAKKKSITERYNFAAQFIQSLPDDAFKKPADTRRKQLVKMLDQSKSKYDSGNLQSASQYLSTNVLNHLTTQGKSKQDLWVTDESSRTTVLRMINELIDVLLRPETLGKIVEGDLNMANHIIEIPTEFELSQNYPNPFNPTTRIQFGLPANAHTKLTIYDMLGREIATIVNADLGAGYHEVEFNGSNLPSGIYIYRIQAGEFTSVKKMILMK